MKKFKHSTVGGTFDHLHAGHKVLLSKAFEVSDKVTVAITSDMYPHKKEYSNSLQTYEQRKKEVINFLQSKKLLSNADFLELHDTIGFAPVNQNLDGIIVTEETLPNARLINEKRASNGLPAIGIELVNLHVSKNGQVISSTKIRRGEMDREGADYLQAFSSQSRLVISEEKKELLRHPFGDVFTETKKAVEAIRGLNPTRIIAVGDIVSKTLKEEECVPDVSIVDLKTRREFLSQTISTEKKLLNTAGTIEASTVEEIERVLRVGNNIVIVIEGEEDLLALPSILLSPLNSVVVYGQYEKGMVVVVVTEEVKQRVYQMITSVTEKSSEHK